MLTSVFVFSICTYLMYLQSLSSIFSYIFPFVTSFPLYYDINKTKSTFYIYYRFFNPSSYISFLWLIILLYYDDNKTKTIFSYILSFRILYSVVYDKGKITIERWKQFNNQKLKTWYIALVSELNILQYNVHKKYFW